MNQKQLNAGCLVRYLDSQGWSYNCIRDNDDQYVARLGMGIEGRLQHVDMIVIASATEIQSMGVCPIKASPSDYATVVEYITRANYGLKIGNFEFDYDDGEIRYQSALVSMIGQPRQEDIERTVDMPIIMFNRYGDGLVKCLMGFGNPEADIREIDG